MNWSPSLLKTFLSPPKKTEKRLSNSKKKGCLQVGQRVWRQNVRNQQRKGGKLEPNFLGPFTTTAIQGKSADLLGDDGSQYKSINVDHLKSFQPENRRVPHKIQISLNDPEIKVLSNTSATTSSPTPSAVSTSTPTTSFALKVDAGFSTHTTTPPVPSTSAPAAPSVWAPSSSTTATSTTLMKDAGPSPPTTTPPGSATSAPTVSATSSASIPTGRNMYFVLGWNSLSLSLSRLCLFGMY